MKITRDLSVFCERDAVDLVICRIEELMGGDWHRSRQGEARMRPVALGEAAFAFVQRSKGERPAVALVMTYDRGVLGVTNIVPRQGELSTNEYNAILTEFHLRFLHPVASGLGLRTELSRDELGAAEVFGWQATKLLKAFSLLANKSALHPLDENRSTAAG